MVLQSCEINIIAYWTVVQQKNNVFCIILEAVFFTQHLTHFSNFDEDIVIIKLKHSFLYTQHCFKYLIIINSFNLFKHFIMCFFCKWGMRLREGKELAGGQEARRWLKQVSDQTECLPWLPSRALHLTRGSSSGIHRPLSPWTESKGAFL